MKILAAAALAAVLLCSGCGHGVIENTEALERFNSQPQAAYNHAAYPVKIENTGSRGQSESITYTRPPQRVIAVWQNSIETLLALGVGDRIIAGTGVPDKKYFLPQYRQQYGQIPYTGMLNLDVETVMMMEPDLIVGWHSTFGEKELRSTDFWHKRGVNTYIAASSVPGRQRRLLADEYSDILNLGKIFDRSSQAEAIVARMRQKVEKAVIHARGAQAAPRGLIIEFLGKDISVYGSKTLAGNILETLHGELLAPEERSISIEQIVDMDPDAIFIVVIESDYGREEQVLKHIYENKALRNIRCVREKRIFALPLYAIYSAGVRAEDGIEIISRGLYPELFKE